MEGAVLLKKMNDHGRARNIGGVALIGRIGADELGEERHEDKKAQEHHAHHGQFVLAEFPPHQLPLAGKIGTPDFLRALAAEKGRKKDVAKFHQHCLIQAGCADRA